MATPHNSAPKGAFAKTVLMPGDPLRAQFIAETFLQDVELVTKVRNIYGYTGTYKGQRVSVMASGMGMPSIGIYATELYKFYDVENIIRVGSAGSYTEKLNVMDVFLSENSYSDSSIAYYQNGCTDKNITPSSELNAVIIAKAKEMGIDLKLGTVHSSDVFYSQCETWQQIKERTHSDCVEMESFALFNTANMLGKRATCLLTISDSFVSKVELTAEERQSSFTTMMKLALESAISF